MIFPQGRLPNRRAPGRKKPKCPDCKHDIRTQHHTKNVRDLDRFKLGYCIKCKVVCPSIVEMYKDENE